MRRVFQQVQRLVDQLDDDIILKRPVDTIRPLGDIFLHILRSGEVYLTGIVTDIWDPIPYVLEKYGTADTIQSLFREVNARINEYLDKITEDVLAQEVTILNRPATKAELLMELIEHTSHHQGQIMVYYRISGIKPAQINYIV